MDEIVLGFVIQNPITTAIIFIVWIHANAGQASATRKCKVLYAGDAGRNGDGTGFACWPLNEIALDFVIQNPITTAVIFIVWIHANAGQATAIIKRIVSNAGDASRDGDAGQTTAMTKRRTRDANDTGRDGDGTSFTFRA